MVILPDRAWFQPDEPVTGRADGDGWIEATRLGRTIVRAAVTDGRWDLGHLAVGGYGLEHVGIDGTVVTGACQVADGRPRLFRYGFVADFPTDLDVGPLVDWACRLHLTAVQFYDWAYRHDRLVPATERYDDPLGRPLDLASVRSLIAALRSAGIESLGYAAVYAFGGETVERWRAHALYRADGRPWQLGEDFLWIADPSDEIWLGQLVEQLAQARMVGFDGFHLDQYGWPKRAFTIDGDVVDLADALPALVDRVRAAQPDATLVFNNVNDFPTASTALADQDATYIEVWAPHDELRHLADLAAGARRAAPARPVVLSAYLSVYGTAAARDADRCLELVMATIWSSGASHLLCGESGAILTDPYYPRHHVADDVTRDLLVRWYDFHVALGDLFSAPGEHDVTRTWFGGVNTEITVEGPVPTSVDPTPGTLWVRVFDQPVGRVIHLVSLAGQDETRWDHPKRPHVPVLGCRVSVELHTRTTPSVWCARPDLGPKLHPLPISVDGDRLVIDIDVEGPWVVLWIEDTAEDGPAS